MVFLKCQAFAPHFFRKDGAYSPKRYFDSMRWLQNNIGISATTELYRVRRSADAPGSHVPTQATPFETVCHHYYLKCHIKCQYVYFRFIFLLESLGIGSGASTTFAEIISRPIGKSHNWTRNGREGQNHGTTETLQMGMPCERHGKCRLAVNAETRA